jgi:NAD(P)-dependent dehydrogenase (short-subunit alcohol dehydrogenase family)
MVTPHDNHPRRALLLTGASRGIGHATVKRFSAAGWRIARPSYGLDRVNMCCSVLRSQGDMAFGSFVSYRANRVRREG